MKTALVLIAALATAIAAPAEEITDVEIQRIKKSSGYGPQPGLPALPCASNHVPFAPVALYLGPQVAPGPQYKESEGNEETAARAYNAVGPVAGGVSFSAGAAGYSGGAAGYSGGAAGYSSGPAVGLFPNAKVGGCNVPLLLSCSPNVVSGHLAASHAYAAPAYKSNEEELKRETRQIPDGRVASHHKVSEDFPEPHPGNHHVISKDYPQPNLTKVTPVTSNSELNKNELEKKLPVTN